MSFLALRKPFSGSIDKTGYSQTKNVDIPSNIKLPAIMGYKTSYINNGNNSDSDGHKSDLMTSKYSVSLQKGDHHHTLNKKKVDKISFNNVSLTTIHTYSTYQTDNLSFNRSIINRLPKAILRYTT